MRIFLRFWWEGQIHFILVSVCLYLYTHLNITTDGSIEPKQALTEASKILIQHFMLFSDEKINLEEEIADDFDEDSDNFSEGVIFEFIF